MVVLGCAATLAHSPPMATFIKLAEQRGWRRSLPPAAEHDGGSGGGAICRRSAL